MSCHHLAPNGDKSLLYQQLEQKYGPQRAHDIWTQTRSQEFLNKYGSPFEDTEPTLEFVEKEFKLEAEVIGPVQQDTRPVETVELSAPGNTLSIEGIQRSIEAVYETAGKNPGKVYQIPYEYTAARQRLPVGASAQELVNLFDRENIPENVRFTPSFEKAMQNTYRRVVEAFGEVTPPELIDRDDRRVIEASSELLLPKKNGGYYAPKEQKEIIDSVVSGIERLYRKDERLKANAVVATFEIFQHKMLQLRAQGDARAEHFEAILDSRIRIAREALYRLEGMGLMIDRPTLSRIMRSVQNLERIPSPSELKDTPTGEDGYEEPGSGELVEQQGRIAKDWSEDTFQLDPKDTASARIKMFLGTLFEWDRGSFSVREDGLQLTDVLPEDLNTLSLPQQQALARRLHRTPFWYRDSASSEKLQEFLSKRFPTIQAHNFLGLPRTADYEGIFQQVLLALGDKSQDISFEEMATLLENHYNPTIRQIADELRMEDVSIQNEFRTVMMKQYQPFTMTTFSQTRSIDGIEEWSLRTFEANRATQQGVLIKQWQEQQKLSDIMIQGPTGERVLDVARIQKEWVPVLQKLQAVTDWSKPANRKDFIQDLGTILRTSGIDFTDTMMADLFDNVEKYTNGGNIFSYLSMRKDGSPSGLFSIFILRSAGMAGLEDAASTEEAVQRAQEQNPLHNEKTSMMLLARVAARHIAVTYSDNHRSIEGKSVYDWGLNTKLSHQFRSFLQSPEQFDKNIAVTDFSRLNYISRFLKDSPAARKDMQLSYLDGMRADWAKEGTTRQSMSDREQILLSVLLFQNNGMGFSSKIPRVHFLSLTHSDKTTTPVFKNMPRLDTGKDGLYPRTMIGASDSAMFNVFKSEYDRITKQAGSDSGNRSYEKGKGLFYLIPHFNFDAMQSMVAEGFLTQEEFETIWEAGTRQLTKVIDQDRELPVINKILERVADELTDTTLGTWRQHGIVKPDEVMFDKSYVKQLARLNGINMGKAKSTTGLKTLRTFTRDGRILTIGDATGILARTAAKDYALNHFLFNVAQMQLFYGDPAEAYKGKSNQEEQDEKGNFLRVKTGQELAVVAASTAEYAKRLAKDIAPRSDLSWGENRIYRSVTLSDVKVRELYMKDLPGLARHYIDDSTNSTDAQEVTTVQEHLDVLFAAGKVREKIYTEMTGIIRAAKGGYYEFTNPEHLAVILQPQKPVYTHRAAPQGGAMLTDYVKSSSYPLYPPFTKGREIDGLRKLLEGKTGNDIQRADFESARKLGNPKETLKVFTEDGRFTAPGTEDVQKAVKIMSRDGLGLQQEVPYDADKEAIKIITQMNENLTEGIGALTEFSVPGHGTLSGTEVKALKESIRKKMLEQNQQELYKKLGVGEDGIVDHRRIMGEIIQAMKTDTRGSYTMNDLQSVLVQDEAGKPLWPLLFNPSAPKVESLLMGMINKVVEVKMPGKSYVQASSTGYRFSEGADLSKVIRVGDYDGTPLKALRIDSQGAVQPGQVILPWNFYDAQGNKLKVEDFLITDDNGQTRLDVARVPQSLLQLVGARIPNQKHSSMHPLEVVGFVPENMGDIVLIPSALVKQMGGDFDVDKLYTYKRPYVYDEGTKSFALHPSGDTHEGLQTDYFNVHWAVLTHKDMIERVMAPLDKDDLVDESKLLKPKAAGIKLFADPMSQLNDFQRGKDAKKLVGMTSWATKYSARIQDKNLRYGLMDFVQGLGLVEREATIKLRDEHTGKDRYVGQLSGTGVSNYTKKDGDTVTEESKRSKSDNHVMVQSESVDNAKNRTLDNLNLTPDTYKAVQALIELQTEDGWAPNSKYWTRLVTQPVIWEFSALMKEGNDSLATEYNPELFKTVMGKLRAKYKETIPEELQDVSDIVFDPQLLLAAQTKFQILDDGGLKHARHQLAVLNLFEKLYEIGNRMLEHESLFSQDVNGAGKDLFSVMDKQRRFRNYTGAPILGAEDIYAQGAELTEAGYTYNVSVGLASDLVSQVLPYNRLVPVFNELAEISGKKNISTDTQRSLLKAFRSRAYSSAPHWWTDPQRERVRLMYGEDSLAKRLLQAKKTWGEGNPFLSRLSTEIGNIAGAPDFVQYNAASKTAATDKQTMTTGWLHLLLSKDATERALGEDLLRYAMLTGGIQDANSFVEFAPAAYLAETTLAPHLRSIEETLLESTEFNDPGLIAQFLQHNPHTAYQLKVEDLGPKDEGREYPETFVPTVATRTEEGAPRSFVSFRSRTEGAWILYQLQGASDMEFYTRIDTLGNKFTDEYDGTAQGPVRSIIPENRSLAQGLPGMRAMSELGSLKRVTVGELEKGENHFEQLGIHAGTGEESVTAALSSLQRNEKLPEYQRTVANFLEQVPMGPVLAEAFNYYEALGYSVIKNPGITFKGVQGFTGMAMPDLSIHLNPKETRSIEEAAETLLHETVHQRLQAILMAAGFDNKAVDMTNHAQHAAFVATFTKNNPEVLKHLKALDNLRYEAYTAFRNRFTPEEFRAIQHTTEVLKEYPTPDHQLLYALGSMQEFVAHVLTSKDVAAFLNTVETREQRTFLERVWDLLSSVLAAFGKALGVQVKEGSVLKEAITRVMALHATTQLQGLGDLTSPLLGGGAVAANSQSQARSLDALYRESYGRDVQTGTDGLDWTVMVQGMPARKTKPRDTSQIGKVLEKLVQQKEDISYALGQTRDHAKRVELGARWIEVKEQIAQLSRTKDVKQIAEVGRDQLRWVDKVLANPSPSLTEVELARRTTTLWEGLTDLLYGTQAEIDPLEGIPELQAAAQQKRIMLLNRSAIPGLTRALDADVKLKRDDFGKNLEDISQLGANFLTLTRAKPQLVNAVATLGWREANNRDEHLGRVAAQLGKLEQKFKVAGLTDNMLIEQDEESGLWGLIGPLSGSWYKFQKGSRVALEGALDAVEKSPNLSDEERLAKRKKLWSEYWKDLKNNAVFVDVRAFFDPTTGDRYTGTGYDSEVLRLTQWVGSRDYAEELIDRAEKQYRNYLDRKEAYERWVDSNAKLAEEEKEGLDVEEQAKRLEQHKQELRNKWLEYNSPTQLLDALESGKTVKLNSEGDKWIVTVPKAGKKEFWNEKYADIKADPRKLAAYQEYRDVLAEMISYLPPEVQNRLPENFLPIVPKDTAGFLATVMAKIKGWDKNTLEALTATDMEAALRARPDRIPLMYLKPNKHTEALSDRSTDLVRVLEIFSMMALQHRYMGNVLDMVNLAEGVMKEVNARRANGVEEGQSLRHVMDALKYFKDRLIFKKPHELEAKIDSAIYKLNPSKQAAIRKEINDLVKERDALNIKMIDENTYLDDESPDKKRVDVIDARLTELEKSARFLYGSKIADTLISINQAKSLSYNPFSAVTNLMFGLISVSIHSNGGMDLDRKTAMDAAGVMMHSVGKYATFGEGDAVARKVHAVMNRVGIMGDVVDTDYGVSNLKSRKKSKLVSAVDPFNWQKSGDYFTKGILTIGMLKKKMVKAVDLSTGKEVEIPLWEALGEDGLWDTTRFQPNEAWSSEDISKQEEWNRYRDRIRKVGLMVFGNQDKNSPLLAKKSWMWRLAGQFRMSWLPEGVANRFMGEYYDTNLQRPIKGRWRSYQDMGIANSAIVLSRQLLASLGMLKKDDVFQNYGGDSLTVRTSTGERKPLAESAIDMENMRRNFAGLAWTAAVTAAILMMEAFGDDEHKKSAKGRQRQLLINMLIRSQQDLMLYSSPSVFNTVSGNFLPATQVVVDYWNAVKSTGHYWFGDTAQEREAFDRWLRKVTKAGIPHPATTLYNKTETMLTRDIDKLSR